MKSNQFSDLFREIRKLKAQIRELENSNQEYFVASARRKKFHLPSCVWASYFLNSSDMIEFFSRSEAIGQGYKPCLTCRS